MNRDNPVGRLILGIFIGVGFLALAITFGPRIAELLR